jgi:tRNA(fMet)-specific endonuclease VapC
VLNRVRYRGERFVVERNGEPIATLEATAAPRDRMLREAVALLRDVPRPDDGFADDLEWVQAHQPPMPEARMAQLIDTSVLIALGRSGPPLGALLGTAPDEPAGIAAITASEILVGVHRADSPQRRLPLEGFLAAIFAAFPVIAFDLAAAERHAEIWARLLADGKSIGAHDLMIAATALAHGYSVLTDNVRDFMRVPGLDVRRPNWDAEPS